MDTKEISNRYLQRALAYYEVAQQQESPELSEKIYSISRDYFEIAKKNDIDESLNDKLGQFHIDYGKLLQRMRKNQLAHAEFLQAQAYEHPEAKQHLISSKSSVFALIDRLQDTKELAVEILLDKKNELLNLLAEQIFEEFMQLPAYKRDAACFAEVENLGAPQNSNLTQRFLNFILEEMEKSPSSFIYHLRALTELFEKAEPAYFTSKCVLLIMQAVNHRLEEDFQLLKEETNVYSFIQALTNLLIAMESMNISDINILDLYDNLYKKIDPLTSHPSLEIANHAHVALQALVRIPQSEKKLVVVFKDYLSSLIKIKFPWMKFALAINNPLCMVKEALKKIENFSEFIDSFHAFQTSLPVQGQQRKWYDVWHLAKILLETRNFNDFLQFLLKQDKEIREEVIAKGCFVSLIPYLQSVRDTCLQRKAIEFFNSSFLDSNSEPLLRCLATAILQASENAQNEDLRLHASEVLRALQRYACLSSEQQHALTSSRCFSPVPALEAQQEFSSSLLSDALGKIKSSFSWWVAAYREKRLNELTSQLDFYISLQGISPQSASPLPLEEMVLDCFAADKRIVLLQGASGSGKTFFCHHFEKTILQNQTVCKTFLPWYISLAELAEKKGHSLSTKLHAFMQEQLSSQEFEQIKQCSLLFLLDGYDEINNYSSVGQSTNLFEEWPQARFLITSHPEALTGLDCLSLFFPIADQREKSLLQEIFIAPLSWEQIASYLDNNLAKQAVQWSTDQYKRTLRALPRHLLCTPLLFSLLIKTLPVLASTAAERNHLTRSQIYDAYIRQWFDSNRIKLRDRESLETQECIRFAQDLAYEMLLRQQVIVRWSEEERTNEETSNWKMRFLGDQHYLLRLGIPLSTRGSIYSFFHYSFLEYFAANKILSSLLDPNFNSSLLNRRTFNKENTLVSFLADCVDQFPLCEKLFEIIEASKVDPEQKIAAANALTILNFAGISFSGRDLRGIQSVDAFLDHAVLDHADLRGANLAGCSLRYAFLGGTRLEGAWLEGIVLGEKIVPQHDAAVLSVSFSPDRQHLASASRDVRLWNLMTGQLMHLLQGHEGIVWSISFSPDGQRLSSGGKDRMVYLWKVSTGQLMHALRGHESEVRSVCFSPDGRQLASASNDHTVRLWEIPSGQPSHILHGHEDKVLSVCFSPDGSLLISGSKDCAMRCWEVASGQMLQTLSDHKDVINAISVSPDGQQFASAGDDCTVCLWKAASRRILHVLHGHKDAVLSVSFSPDGWLLVSGSKDCTMRFWEVSSGQLLHTLKGHENWVWSVNFSSNGQELASASEDGIVRIWESAVWQELRNFRGHKDGVWSISFSPDGQLLASASQDHTVRVWTASSGQLLHILQGHNANVWSVNFSPNGQLLASAGQDHTVRIWEANSGELLHTLKGHRDDVWSINFSPDGQLLASASFDHTVRMWRISSGQLLHTLQGHEDEVWSVSFSPDSKQLASASFDRTVRIWEVNTGRLVHSLEGHADVIKSISFSPDGKQLASASFDRTVRIWEVDSGRLVYSLQGQENWIRSVHFSPDGQRIASAGIDGQVNLWQASSGQLLHILRQSGAGAKSIRFSPDGKQLASTGKNTVSLWQVESGKMLQTMCGHEGWVTSVQFSPDGQQIASAGEDCTVKIWKKGQADRFFLEWSTPHPLFCRGAQIQSPSLSLSIAQRAVLLQKGAVIATE